MATHTHKDQMTTPHWNQQEPHLTQIYKTVSRLYKNPTRVSGGYAATDTDQELRKQLELLHDTFLALKEQVKQHDDTLYCKIISLVFEVDDYLGNQPRVEKLVLDEYDDIRGIIKSKAVSASEMVGRSTRSLWKAKIRCALAALELWRSRKGLSAVNEEFSDLEKFCVESGLHSDEAPAWTTVSLISVNYAKLARKQYNYELAKEKFNDGTTSLYYRLCEILNSITALRERIQKSSQKERPKLQAELEELEDDLVFIKQKQTLSSLFNLGLTSIQRGHLKRALHCCTAARVEFTLHGRHFHRLFNELLLLSIERTLTPPADLKTFLMLEKKLVELVYKFQPNLSGPGHPRFYIYGLYELSIVRYYCNKMNEAEKMLRIIDSLKPVKDIWKSRTALIRAHIKRKQWKDRSQAKLLDESLEWAGNAVSFASKGQAVENEADAWLAKGRVYVHQGKLAEAKECAETALSLLRAIDNPKLRAMACLVLASACLIDHDRRKAESWLRKVALLKPQVDYRYVLDKYEALHDELKELLDSFTIEAGQREYNYLEEQDNLLGWMILQVYHPGATINSIALALKLKDVEVKDKTIDRRHIISKFIKKHMTMEKYEHLSVLLREPKK